MKTKLLFSVLILLLPFSFLLSPCTAQVPMGFNYQAIARDGSGAILANTALPVKITIQTSTGTVIYEELFSSVVTNQFGLISLVVGTGVWQNGSALTFPAIDWKSQSLYLKTTIQYPGTTWTVMGTSQIWGVPYSMIARDLQGPLSKLGITGTTDVMDEALFEVKNKAGNTVFAVYNEGIRAYVGSGTAKGVKGGFSVGGYDAAKSGTVYDIFVLSTDSARIYLDSKPKTVKGVKGGFSVGGYDMTKGTSQNFLMASKDSVRIYVDSNPATKGVKGGFSVGGYDMAKAGSTQNYLEIGADSVRIYVDESGAKGVKGGFAVGGYDATKGTTKTDYLNVQPSANYVIKISEPRVLWYPIKNAFLTGQVLIQSKDSIGLNSTTTGFESRAKGNWSQAMGYKAIARGLYSTAIGNQAVAHKDNSFALGDGAYAGSLYSYAFGKNSRTKGDYAFALGNGATASGYSSYAIGENVTTPNSYSYAFGKSSSTGASYAFAMGNGTQANGFSSYSLGESALAANQYSYAFGKGSKAQGDYAFALGNLATASGANSFALGESVTASYPNSYAFGKGSSATANYAVAMGYNASAQGLSSFAIGGTASGESSKAFGGTASKLYAFSAGNANTEASGDYSIAMGENVKASGNNAVSIGSGTYLYPTRTLNLASGNWAIAIGNNNTASGVNAIAIGAGVKSTGLAAVGMGLNVTAQPFNSFVVGYDNEISGTTGAWVETEPLFIVGNGSYGGRPSHNALTILKNGNVGIGSSSPGSILHLKGNQGVLNIEGSDHCYIQWYPYGCASGRKSFMGFAAASTTTFSVVNENAAGSIVINPGTSGYVGINNSSPAYKLDVGGTMRVSGALNFSDPFTRSVTSPRYLYVTSSGEVGGINASSIRYKENVFALEDYGWLYQLRPVKYNYKNSVPSDIQYGMIAEEVDTINSLLVEYKDNRPEGIMYEKLTVPMLKAIQDQKKEIDRLNDKVEQLEKMVNQLISDKK